MNGLAKAQYRSTDEILTEGRTVPKVVEAGKNLSSFTTVAAKRLAAKLKVIHECDRGCSWCCHQPVGVFIPEVLAIAAHLRDTKTAMELDDIRDKLRRQVASLEGVTDIRKVRQTCALLVEGRCSIYDRRPAVCGSYFSQDEAACKRQHDTPEDMGFTIPVYGTQVFSATGAGAGLALERHDLDDVIVLLSRALLIALDNAEAGQQYLDGLPVFATAVYDQA